MTSILPSPDPNKALLQRIEEFLDRTPGMSATRFGLAAAGDGALIKNLREGRSVSLTLGQKLLDFIAEQDAANSGQGAEPSGKIDAAAITQPASEVGEAA